MTRQLWIWKNRLTEVLTTISDEINMELSSSSLDEIKYGLAGTSDEKDNWFDYTLGDVTLRLAVDNDNNDIVHFQIDGLNDKSIDGLSEIGTRM
ncbi:MAG: hypothetical protein J0L67_04890 [Cytophagales bacterium]|nr:hypothetical protein [Cytophagales bacterium]